MRDAASLVLIRGTQPWSVLLFRRPDASVFAPSSFVFPGGSVEPGDRASPDPWRSAAIREAFEEVGILLARGRDGRIAGRAECEAVRSGLVGGASWTRALEQARVSAAYDALVAIDRWVTPPVLDRRFDTSFYMTLLPPHQDVLADPREVGEVVWIAPSQAMSDTGPPMLQVTRRVLDRIASEEPGTRVLERMAQLPPPPSRMGVVRERADGSFEYAGFEVLGDGLDRRPR